MIKIYKVTLTNNWSNRNFSSNNFNNAHKKAVEYLKEEREIDKKLDIESIELVAQANG